MCEEYLKRIKLLAAFGLFISTVALFTGCTTATSSTGTYIPAPWGAVDYCERHPDSIWCKER